jgi:hypothetical protein
MAIHIPLPEKDPWAIMPSSMPREGFLSREIRLLVRGFLAY